MSHSDELAVFEAQGRKFAVALFDAGFVSQMVEDAAVGPCMRLAELPAEYREPTGNLLAPETRTTDELRKIARGGFMTSTKRSYAFFTGVMAEIEVRR